MAGSASTLIAATMQMSGEYTQAYILDAISNSALVNLAIFIYVLGAIGFLISVAVFQDYKNGLWLILGPALWDFTVHTRNDEVNVNWMYAGQQVMERTQLEAWGNPKASAPTKYGAPSAGPATVYVMWDRVVSGTVQVLGSIIKNVAEDKSTQIFARLNIQNAMLNSHISSKEIMQAAAYAMQYCSATVLADRARSETDILGTKPGNWDEQSKTEMESALLSMNLGADIPLPIWRRLCQRRAAFNYWQSNPGEPYQNVIEFANQPTCDTAPFSELRPTFSNPDSNFINCYDYSQLVWEAIRVEAEIQMRKALHKAGANEQGVNAAGLSVLPDWQEFLRAKGQLNTLVAGYATKNSLDILTNAINRINQNTGNLNAITDGNADLSLAFEAEKQSYSTVVQAYFFAKSIFYLQGALLYFLALAFPIIATVILIPGMHKAVFTWMGAWAWVKSWEVMFYVIDVFSGVLSEYVLHKSMIFDAVESGNVNTLNFSNYSWDRLSKVNLFHDALYQSFTDIDPRFTAGVLSWVISLATMSIPVFTGILFLVGRASALSGMGAALTSKAEDASRRAAAAQEDSWLRSAEIARQKDVRVASIVGSAVGGIVGNAIAPGVGGYIGIAAGSLAGEKYGSVTYGDKMGGSMAIASGRSLAAPTGDILDPIEMGLGMGAGVGIYQYSLIARGAPSQGLMGEYANNRPTINRNILNSPAPFSGNTDNYYGRR